MIVGGQGAAPEDRTSDCQWFHPFNWNIVGYTDILDLLTNHCAGIADDILICTGVQESLSKAIYFFWINIHDSTTDSYFDVNRRG